MQCPFKYLILLGGGTCFLSELCDFSYIYISYICMNLYIWIYIFFKQIFFRYVIYKYFLPVCGLSFHSLNSGFWGGNYIKIFTNIKLWSPLCKTLWRPSNYFLTIWINKTSLGERKSRLSECLCMSSNWFPESVLTIFTPAEHVQMSLCRRPSLPLTGPACDLR